MSTYYDQICSTKLLTREQEFELLKVFKSETSSELEKKRAKDELITANLRFVFKTAKKYARRYPASFDDLLSAGNEGLVVGLIKYDINSGHRLLTYAGWWIIQRILKEMSKLRLVSLPIWKQQVAAKIAKLKEENEEITFTEIRAQLPDIAEKDIKELSETAFLTCFIDDLSDKELSPIEFEVEDELDHLRLHQNIADLPEQHRNVLMLSMGFDDGKEKSVREVCKTLGLTKDMVTELKREALEMLKEKY